MLSVWCADVFYSLGLLIGPTWFGTALHFLPPDALILWLVEISAQTPIINFLLLPAHKFSWVDIVHPCPKFFYWCPINNALVWSDTSLNFLLAASIWNCLYFVTTLLWQSFEPERFSPSRRLQALLNTIYSSVQLRRCSCDFSPLSVCFRWNNILFFNIFMCFKLFIAYSVMVNGSIVNQGLSFRC